MVSHNHRPTKVCRTLDVFGHFPTYMETYFCEFWLTVKAGVYESFIGLLIFQHDKATQWYLSL